MKEYALYVVDTETTGLNAVDHDVIEISLYRINDDKQKTWFIQPINPDAAQPIALKINGHKIEDLKHQTKYGKDTYKDPSKTLIEIENWLSEDNQTSENRVMIGHNVAFDKTMLEYLWSKCNAKESFPFGRRTMDTMIWAFMMDYAQNTMSESYSLSNLIKKFGIKNEKAHSAEADVKATKELFQKQVEELRKKLNIK